MAGKEAELLDPRRLNAHRPGLTPTARRADSAWIRDPCTLSTQASGPFVSWICWFLPADPLLGLQEGLLRWAMRLIFHLLFSGECLSLSFKEDFLGGEA